MKARYIIDFRMNYSFRAATDPHGRKQIQGFKNLGIQELEVNKD